MTWYEYRAECIRLAALEEGWTRFPPRPGNQAARLQGRIFIKPYTFRGRVLLGRVPNDPLLDIEASAREKRQNRTKF